MSGTIDYAKVFSLGAEVDSLRVDRDAAFLLLFVFIHQKGKLEGSFADFVSFFLRLVHELLVDLSELVQELTTKRTLSRVDISDDDHINGALHRFLINLYGVFSILFSLIIDIRVLCIEDIVIHYLVKDGDFFLVFLVVLISILSKAI